MTIIDHGKMDNCSFTGIKLAVAVGLFQTPRVRKMRTWLLFDFERHGNARANFSTMIVKDLKGETFLTSVSSGRYGEPQSTTDFTLGIDLTKHDFVFPKRTVAICLNYAVETANGRICCIAHGKSNRGGNPRRQGVWAGKSDRQTPVDRCAIIAPDQRRRVLI